METGRNARQLMNEFAERTGLKPESNTLPPRYLWTDAFAVCNYLALYRQSGLKEDLKQAVLLVDQVHKILGRHRDDDPRNGWISGFAEEKGKLHPTAGGLRIGKKLPERLSGDPPDDRLEWDSDGQYYHYLTKWMHALCCIGIIPGNQVYLRLAAELAARSHTAFAYTAPDGYPRMYWKMSIDLSRPLVRSMGHHDPLDGLISFLAIRSLCSRHPQLDCPILDEAIDTLAVMCQGGNWATDDPLGLGTLLADAWRLAQLLPVSAPIPPAELFSEMLQAVLLGLSVYEQDSAVNMPAAYRLAFRELGLAIGLQAIPRIKSFVRRNPDLFPDKISLTPVLQNLEKYMPLQERILQFWLAGENRQVSSWTEHEDINTVMLATCLLPGGYLDLRRFSDTGYNG